MFGKLGLSLLRNVSQIILNIKLQLINDNSNSILLDSILLNDSVVSCGSIYRTYDVPDPGDISYLRFGIIKFNNNDNLDSTFGDYGITYVNYNDITTSGTRESTGIVTTDMCDLIGHSYRQSIATCMCIQSIGGTDYILIGGHANIMYIPKYVGDNYVTTSIPVFSIARYNLNGTLDTGFGLNGRVVIDIGAAGSSSDIFNGSDPLLLFRSNFIRDIGVLSDGNIIVCGYISSQSYSTSSGGGSDDGVIAKFSPNGDFLSKNIITTTSTMKLNGLIINTDIIYCCGESDKLVGGEYSASGVFLIAFNSNLTNKTDFGSHSYTNSILNTTYYFTKNYRYQPSPINTGRTSAGISISIIQNKIIVSGHIGILSGHYGTTGIARTICTLEMYDMTGAILSSLDMDYDYPGILASQSSYSFKTSTITKQTISGDDKIILGYIGFGTVSGSSGNTVVTAARVNIDGNTLVIDTNFGNGRLALPIISLPIDTQTLFQKAINISSTNNIIITGYSIQNYNIYHFMTRFEENGAQP